MAVSPKNPALDIANFNRPGITSGHRGDVSDELGFIEGPPLLVGEDAVVGEIFFPSRLVSGHDGIVQLLCATDEFVLGDRCICGMGASVVAGMMTSTSFITLNMGKGESGRKN